MNSAVNRGALMRAADDAMSDFKFAKVRFVMRLLNWKWYTCDQGFAVPSVERLRSAASELFNICVDKVAEQLDSGQAEADYETKTGGLKARMSVDAYGTICATLVFEAVDTVVILDRAL